MGLSGRLWKGAESEGGLRDRRKGSWSQGASKGAETGGDGVPRHRVLNGRNYNAFVWMTGEGMEHPWKGEGL